MSLRKLAFLALCLASAIPGQGQEKSQLTAGGDQVLPDLPNAYRILFIGDSITIHGTNADVQRELKWNHVAGMAASKMELDFAHRLAALIQGTLPDRVVQIAYPVIAPNFAESIAQYRLGTAGQNAATIQASKSLRPNLIVIQLGEHERESDGMSVTRANYERLFKSFDEWSPKPAILCTGVWYPMEPGADGKREYRDAPAALDRMLSELCKSHNIPFVSVAKLAMDPSCRGWGETGGVKWHPNDKGHEGYAIGLFEAFQTLPALAAQTSR
jgi:hypothetical protein